MERVGRERENMLQDMIQPNSKPLSIEDVSSPIAVQILDFCADDDAGAGGDVFPTSGSHNNSFLLCSSDEVSSSLATVVTTCPDSPLGCYADDPDPSFSPFSSLDTATLSSLLEAHLPPSPLPPEPELDLIRAVHYPSSSSSTTSTMFPIRPPYHHQDPFDHIALTPDAFTVGYPPYSSEPTVIPMSGEQQQPVMFDDECYVASSAAAALQPATQFLDFDGPPPPHPPYGFLEGSCSSGCIEGFYNQGSGAGMGMAHLQGFLNGGMMSMRPETGGLVCGAAGDLPEYPKMENCGLGLFGEDSMQRSYSSGDLQVIAGGNLHLMSTTGCSSSSSSLPTAHEISAMDESTFKVGRLSVEERKEKIHRYMKKRNQRNFSKKIKYACRKTLADSRPRVRGRFAKNDDQFGEAARTSSGSHEFNDEEDAVVKEVEELLDSSDIFAHMSGVDSLKYNYALESWI